MSDPVDATLAARLWRTEQGARLLRNMALAFGGSLALVVSAKAQVPFYPVPMTLQTLVVLIVGAAFGARLGAATVALYLAEGLMGLPVFAGAAAGPLYMAGPTGGFLAGFLVAAALIGFLVERGWDRSFGRLLAAVTLGHIAVFALGFAWLALLIGPAKALTAGVAPFVLATIVKTVLAASLVRAVSGAVSRRDA